MQPVKPNPKNMTLILEPCCFRKQLDELLSEIEENVPDTQESQPGILSSEKKKREAAHFFTYGDFSLPEFMDYFIGRCPECDVFLSLVHVEMTTIHSIATLMERKDKKGNFLIRSFTLLSQGKNRKEISDSLFPYIHSGRMAICEDTESFRCLSVGNQRHHYILNGSINQVPVFSMQMFTLTTSLKLYEDVLQVFRIKKRKKLRQTYIAK